MYTEIEKYLPGFTNLITLRNHHEQPPPLVLKDNTASPGTG